MPRKHRPKKMCCKCGSVGHYKCAGCPYGKRVRYCGRVCQKADWGRHQVKCPRVCQKAKQTTSSPSTVPVSAAAVPSYVRSLPTCTEKVIYWQEPITGEVSNGYRVLVPGGRTVVTTAEMRTVDGAITLCGILGIVADEFALGAWAVSDILAEQVTLFRSKTSFLRAVRPCVLVVLCTDDTFADSAPDSFNSRRFQAGEGRVWSDV
jgi:hypothetical protein